MSILIKNSTDPSAQEYNKIAEIVEPFRVFGGAVRDLLQGKLPKDLDLLFRTDRFRQKGLQTLVAQLGRDYELEVMPIVDYRTFRTFREQAQIQMMEELMGLSGYSEYCQELARIPGLDLSDEVYQDQLERLQARYPELFGTPERRREYQAQKKTLLQELVQARTEIFKDLELIPADTELSVFIDELKQRIDKASPYSPACEKLQAQLYLVQQIGSQEFWHVHGWIYRHFYKAAQKIADLHHNYEFQMEQLKQAYSDLFKIEIAEKKLELLEPEQIQPYLAKLIEQTQGGMSMIRLVILGPTDKVPRKPCLKEIRRKAESVQIDAMNLWKSQKPTEPPRQYVVRFPDWVDEAYFQERVQDWKDRKDWEENYPVKVPARELYDPTYMKWLKQKPVEPVDPDPIGIYDYTYDEDDYDQAMKLWRKKMEAWKAQEPKTEAMTRVCDAEEYQSRMKLWTRSKPHIWGKDPASQAKLAQLLTEWEARKPVLGQRSDGQLTDREFLDQQQRQLDLTYQRLMTKYQTQLEKWMAEMPTKPAQTESDTEVYDRELKQWKESMKEFWATEQGQFFGEHGFHIDLVTIPDYSLININLGSEVMDSRLFDFTCNTLSMHGGRTTSLVGADVDQVREQIQQGRAVAVGDLDQVAPHRIQKMLDKGFKVE